MSIVRSHSIEILTIQSGSHYTVQLQLISETITNQRNVVHQLNGMFW